MCNSVLQHEFGDWTDLSSSNSEGTLCYQSGEIFIIVKVRKFNIATNPDFVFGNYLKRLRKEVEVLSPDTLIFGSPMIRDGWVMHSINIESQMAQYALYAYEVAEDGLHVLEVIAPEAEDYQTFESEFEHLISEIDFSGLCSEFAIFRVGDENVAVEGISDVQLKSCSDEGAVFVGKDKYFAVQVGNSLRNQMHFSAADVASPKKDCDIERTYICNGNQISGTLEFSNVLVDGNVLSFMGYWVGEQTETILDNLEMEVITDALKTKICQKMS